MIANEFTNTIFRCVDQQIVPQVPGATEAFQTCAVVGSTPGSLNVDGGNYIQQSYGYTRAHLWRNLGFCIAFALAYIAAAALFTELFDLSGSGGAATVFIRTKKAKKNAVEASKPTDEEKGPIEKAGGKEQAAKQTGLGGATSIFTFKDICYTVPTADGPKQLLDNVTGMVYPGKNTALMGASGAGKTTLLNTLALRHNPQQVSGEILIDGKPTTSAFARREPHS